MSLLVERFARIVRDTPDRPLVHHASTGVTITAAGLAALARRHEGWLRRHGTESHQLVMVAVGNRPAALALWLACRACGAAVMPVDPGVTAAEIAALGRRFGASLALLPPDFSGTARPGAQLEAPPEFTAFTIDAEPDAAVYEGAAALKLTSGSTGLPKATFTTEAQLLVDTEHIVEAMEIGRDDVQIAAIPLSHAYGLGNLLVPALTRGTPLVLRESFVPHQLAADARQYGARVFPGVPFMFDHFLGSPPEGGWPPSLCRLMSAGARLEPSTVLGFAGRFGVKIHSFYGTTETGGIAFDDDDEVREIPSVGHPMRDVAISLRPVDGAPDGGGRVHVAGPAVSSGYAGEPLADGDFDADGYLTGDYGHFEDGRLYLTGRLSLFINVAGRKVQPEEVEQVLRQMPSVRDVRVLPAPDPVRGQQIVACILPRNGERNVLAVRQFCAGRLAPYKIPRAIVWLDRIPLTARGKTDRPALEALLRDHSGAEAHETDVV
jgi:long-chain acyl-CoA synthetase